MSVPSVLPTLSIISCSVDEEEEGEEEEANFISIDSCSPAGRAIA